MDVQIGCFTIPYSQFSFQRAVDGIAAAGYQYLGLGTPHQDGPTPQPDATDAQIQDLASTITDAGLKPWVLFGFDTSFGVPGTSDRYRRRLEVASILGAPYVLSAGPSEYEAWPDEKLPDSQWQQISDQWFEGIMAVAPRAEELGVQILLKPHMGATAFGRRLHEAVERIASPAVRACYDGGNVHFYEGLDPVEDIKDCVEHVVALCVKDHTGPRANPIFPPPGEGDVDHPAMLRVLDEHGFDGPLMVERFEGDWAGEDVSAELIDQRARAAWEYIQQIVAAI